MPTEHRFAQNFSTHLSNKNSWTSLGKVHPMKPQTIKWYTDGFLTDEGSGLGVVGLRLKYHELMGRYTSIFQAEVCAIGRCAEFNLQRNYRDKDIDILSDSQAAIKALSKAKITSKLVNEVRTALDKLGAVNKLTI
ncbi:lian-aa1 retrotransposon protein, partial [Lasius niger]